MVKICVSALRGTIWCTFGRCKHVRCCKFVGLRSAVFSVGWHARPSTVDRRASAVGSIPALGGRSSQLTLVHAPARCRQIPLHITCALEHVPSTAATYSREFQLVSLTLLNCKFGSRCCDAFHFLNCISKSWNIVLQTDL